MSTIKSFTDLNAWKEGHELVLSIYSSTKTFPAEEKFGLVDQMRRCSVSITSNIAEGFSRRSNKEKTQFFYIALGSTAELQSQLLVARDINYLTSEHFRDIAEKQLLLIS